MSVNKRHLLNIDGPLLIAANHPNSFLDAIIVASLFRRPVYSLARGDAFSNRFYERLLRAIRILPVYRISEGAHNLGHNYKTFDACRDIFRQNGIVLIFSEGLCVNEWNLRPLKKGTARLALSCWQQGIPLRVIPLGINYSSFKKFGKIVHLNFGDYLAEQGPITNENFGQHVQMFNQALQAQLHPLVDAFDKNDQASIRRHYSVSEPAYKKWLLFLPALAGKWLHIPLYGPVKIYLMRRVPYSDHFDSIQVGLLFLLYPLYLALASLLMYFLFGFVVSMASLLLLPFFAWSYLHTRDVF